MFLNCREEARQDRSRRRRCSWMPAPQLGSADRRTAPVVVKPYSLRKGSAICFREHAQVAAPVKRGGLRRIRQDQPHRVCVRVRWSTGSQEASPYPIVLPPRRPTFPFHQAACPAVTVRICVGARRCNLKSGAHCTDADIAGGIDIDTAGWRAGPDAERQPAAAGDVADEEIRLVGADIPGLCGKAAGAGLFVALRGSVADGDVDRKPRRRGAQTEPAGSCRRRSSLSARIRRR